MIKNLITIIAIILICNISIASDRYWVNGSDSWNNISQYVNIDKNTSESSIPDSSVNVYSNNISFLPNKAVIIKDYLNGKPDTYKNKALLILFISTTDITCYDTCDGTATVDSIQGGAPPYFYTWSNGDTDATADSLCADTFGVFVMDGFLIGLVRIS